MSGFMLVALQVAVVVAVAALLAGTLGFLLGRRRRPPAPTHAVTSHEPSAVVRRLEAELDRKQRALHDLEARAVARWDATVPGLQDELDRALEQNRALTAQVDALRDSTDGERG